MILKLYAGWRDQDGGDQNEGDQKGDSQNENVFELFDFRSCFNMFLSLLRNLWLPLVIVFLFPNAVVQSSYLKLLDLLISVVPNLLGFGIGVYALIFIFPSGLDERLKGEGYSLERLSVDMAFPLVFMMLSIFIAVMIGYFSLAGYGVFVFTFFSWTYLVELVVGLIGMLYGLSVAVNKVQKS
ncbi:hypothetical protein [Chromobacterium haemolyticum]|uniref:hypothetical protein n=1 Tax=Chromobacterium haemolyticum TaxID=394935 RepID=UPI0013B476DF|nr:hypothetical protein [Chromobacterium haemolyticum]